MKNVIRRRAAWGRALAIVASAFLTSGCFLGMSGPDMFEDPVYQSLFVAMRVLEHPGSHAPFNSEATTTCDPALIGNWTDPWHTDTSFSIFGNSHQPDTTWTFAPDGESACGVTITRADWTASFTAVFWVVDAHRYLDLAYVPTEPPAADQPFALHVLFRFTPDGDELLLLPISKEWLRGVLSRGDVQLEYQDKGARIVLDAPTEELQELMRRLDDDPQAFASSAPEDDFNLTRVQSNVVSRPRRSG